MNTITITVTSAEPMTTAGVKPEPDNGNDAFVREDDPGFERKEREVMESSSHGGEQGRISRHGHRPLGVHTASMASN
jgi:hypothetical protein